MDCKTGKIYLNPTDKELIEKQLRMLESNEYSFLEGLPESERPIALALHDFVKKRAANGRANVSIQERTAFRLGFKAAQDLFAV